MAKQGEKPISSFLIDKKDLSQDELWKLIMYCCTAANNEEKWELEVSAEFHWVTGSARGNDTGKFYQFLVQSGLDKKIEIVRG